MRRAGCVAVAEIGRASRWVAGSIGLLVLVSGSGATVGQETIVAGVRHIRNGKEPAQGTETLRLDEQWRTGAGEDDILLGVVWVVETDVAGNVYLLDRQLNQVHVYAPDGRFLRTIVQEGDGPGEVRFATALVRLADGRIAVGRAMPGGFVVVDPDGDPAGSIDTGGDSAAGGFNFLHEAACRGDDLVILGRRMIQTEGGFDRVQFLSAIDLEGNEKVRYLERSSPDRLVTGKFIEREEYFVSQGRWALGPDGRVYTAEERDRYAIRVYEPDGRLVQVIEREFEPRRRTAEEKERVGSNLMVVVNGERMRLEAEAEDFAPCITSLHVTDAGELWVLSGRGTHDQSPGILRTYDVFDTQGRFVRQVAIECAGDAGGDGLFFLGTDRVVQIKGLQDAMRGHTGAATEEELEEAEPLEVICYTRAGT